MSNFQSWTQFNWQHCYIHFIIFQWWAVCDFPTLRMCAVPGKLQKSPNFDLSNSFQKAASAWILKLTSTTVRCNSVFILWRFSQDICLPTLLFPHPTYMNVVRYCHPNSIYRVFMKAKRKHLYTLTHVASFIIQTISGSMNAFKECKNLQNWTVIF